MEKNIVVFAPHPDDEVLGCGGTIAKKLSEGQDIYIVFITDGRYALTELGIFSNPTPLEMKDIRKEEALKAAEILGLEEENLIFLDFEDKTLAKSETAVQEKILQILNRLSPIEVFFPQRREYNADHRATNKIIKKAIELSNLNLIQYEYIIAWRFPFYLLLHIFSEDTFDRYLVKLFNTNLIHFEISKYLRVKEIAIKEYKSQVTILSPRQKRPALKNSFLERFLRNEEKFFSQVETSDLHLTDVVLSD